MIFSAVILCQAIASGKTRVIRLETISNTEATLENFIPTKIEAEKYAEVRYIFDFPPIAIPEPVVVITPTRPTATEPQVAAPPPPVISREEILEEFAARLNVTGSLFFGGRQVLIQPGGPQIVEGQQVRFNHGGSDYIISIESIGRDTYTLRLDETLKVVIFDKTARPGAIQIGVSP